MMSDQKILISISKELATNTESTKNIEKHLAILNGKVATQEANSATLKTAVDLQQATIQGLVTRETNTIDALEEKRKTGADRRSRLAWLTVDNLFRVAYAVALAIILYRIGI